MADGEGPDDEVAGGEVRPPAARRLERAPGERFAGGVATGPGGAIRDGAVQPHVGRAALFGDLALTGVAAVWALASGVFDVSWGLVILAAAGGWLIGSSVSLGAWRGVAHPPDPRVQAIAAAEGVVAWIAGTFGGYVVGLALLPGSTASLGERMANAPFADALLSQFSLVDIASILLLAGIAWRSAR